VEPKGLTTGSKVHVGPKGQHYYCGQQNRIDKICDEYDIFHLLGDTLTFKIAAEHAIPTPAIDPSTAANTKSYRIPEIYKGKVKRHIAQMLVDDIIQPITSPWNCPIFVIPNMFFP
jgi:hypothetical protein